jgi:hypothetical protein
MCWPEEQRYRHNVWDGAQCDATDLDAPPGFRDPGHDDLHVLPGSAAIGAGDAWDRPAHDIDGQRRPAGSGVDAGADQVTPAL